MSRRPRNRVLILVQNLPVPQDRRVWRECLALRDAGYQVSVICPRASGQVRQERVEGILVRRYHPPPTGMGAPAYAVEFAWAWLATAGLTLRALLREGFDVVQACNPPDTLFLLASPFKLLGKSFVFDHHDLSPELYAVRFGRNGGPVVRLLRFFERSTFRAADRVISTNHSYRRKAIRRGGANPRCVTVVRNGPDLDWARPRPPRPELRRGRDHLACYLGVMGPQDGLDWLLRAIAILVHDMGRTDCQFTLMGSGDCLEDLRALAAELRLEEWVTFTGWTEDEDVFDHLATADLGLSPDPVNPFNNFSTMNKTLEYMAFGLPIVAFDLAETRFSAGEAAVYATPGDAADYARWVDRLLADPARRALMGEVGRQRIREELAWDHQVPAYVGLYEELLGRVVWIGTGEDDDGRGNGNGTCVAVGAEGQASVHPAGTAH